jgi:hypothetical protein
MRWIHPAALVLMSACSGAPSEPASEPRPHEAAATREPEVAAPEEQSPAEPAPDPREALRLARQAAAENMARNFGATTVENPGAIEVDMDCRRAGCPEGFDFECVREDRPASGGRPAIAAGSCVARRGFGGAGSGAGGAGATPPPAGEGLVGHGGQRAP